MQKMVAGNWKMFGSRELVAEFHALSVAIKSCSDVHCTIFPPAILMEFARNCWDERIEVGIQDCGVAKEGAYTGDISAHLAASLGARSAIVGHSERRMDRGDNVEVVRKKVHAAVSADLNVVFCVGETHDAREDGHSWKSVLKSQLESLRELVFHGSTLSIAYEPVWAIGTGLRANSDQIVETHAFVKDILTEIIGDLALSTPILYGGSVKPDNAAELASLPGVDGALVGGASLNVESFAAIVKAFHSAS